MSDMRITEYTPMQTLIRLVSAGAQKKCVDDLKVDWKAVLPLAVDQNVLSLVACALLHSPELDCPEDLKEYLLDTMRNEASVNMIRRQRILQLLAEMKEAGIDAKVLKGYAVADYYAHPECRGSVDTDLLIDTRQEKQAIQFFEERGFRVSPRVATSQHVVCQHKKYGMVELHVALYAELIRDIWFQGMNASELIKEPFIDIKGAKGNLYTLGHTDQLIFLVLHMVKHFILEGLTIRMMLDVTIYFWQNRDRIDVERLWFVMKTLNYTSLVNCILGCFIHYGDFPNNMISVDGAKNIKLENQLLADIQIGGYLGIKQKDLRYEGGMEYNRRLMLKKKSVFEYKAYMVYYRFRTGAKSMFPSYDRLQEMYPCVRKCVLLAPPMWMWQAISFPIRKLFAGVLNKEILSENSRISVEAKNRVKLFEDLNML